MKQVAYSTVAYLGIIPPGADQEIAAMYPCSVISLFWH